MEKGETKMNKNYERINLKEIRGYTLVTNQGIFELKNCNLDIFKCVGANPVLFASGKFYDEEGYVIKIFIPGKKEQDTLASDELDCLDLALEKIGISYDPPKLKKNSERVFSQKN